MAIQIGDDLYDVRVCSRCHLHECSRWPHPQTCASSSPRIVTLPSIDGRLQTIAVMRGTDFDAPEASSQTYLRQRIEQTVASAAALRTEMQRPPEGVSIRPAYVPPPPPAPQKKCPSCQCPEEWHDTHVGCTKGGLTRCLCGMRRGELNAA